MHKVVKQMFIGFISDDENLFYNKTIFFTKKHEGNVERCMFRLGCHCQPDCLLSGINTSCVGG
jgi:hypothetical protein